LFFTAISNLGTERKETFLLFAFFHLKNPNILEFHSCMIVTFFVIATKKVTKEKSRQTRSLRAVCLAYALFTQSAFLIFSFNLVVFCSGAVINNRKSADFYEFFLAQQDNFNFAVHRYG
jgi:hypothetical protein